MSPNHSNQLKASAQRVVQYNRRTARRHFSPKDTIKVVLERLRGEDTSHADS